MNLIPTPSLRSPDVPGDSAAWATISQFALTFPGYEWAGSFKECADLANSARHGYEISTDRQVPKLMLDELRACLFFEERRFRHFGAEPSGEDLLYIRALVQGIREKVAMREAGQAL